MTSFIETYTGRKFYLYNPVFSIHDIAGSLENQCRFRGHINSFFSVAAHSVLVSHIMAKEKLGNPFEGLMHDAAEAYIGDMSTPFKGDMPDFVLWEDYLDREIRKHWSLPEKKTEGCARADLIALVAEGRAFQRSNGRYLNHYLEEDPSLLEPVERYSNVLSGRHSYSEKGRFLSKYYQYIAERWEPSDEKNEEGVCTEDQE